MKCNQQIILSFNHSACAIKAKKELSAVAIKRTMPQLALFIWALVFIPSPSYSSSARSSYARQSINRSKSRVTLFVPSWKWENSRAFRLNNSNERKLAGFHYRIVSDINIFPGIKSDTDITPTAVFTRTASIICCGVRGGGDDQEVRTDDCNTNPKTRGGFRKKHSSDNANNNETHLKRSRAFGISLSLCITYLTVMGAKCALPSTLSLLTSPNSGLSHPSSSILSRQDVISNLLAFSTLSIATGKLALGPIIDSLGGIASLQIALSTLGVCLGSIGFGPQTCPTLTSLAVYWIIVDFAFSSCWAACVKTIREYLEEEKWAREIGRLAVAARTGNAVSFAFFAWLLQWASGAGGDNSGSRLLSGATGSVDSSWRWVFRASGAIQLVPLLMLTYFGEKNGSNNAKQIIDGHSTIEQPDRIKKESKLKISLDILRKQSRTVEFWLHLLSRSIIMVLVSFLLFIPTYMTQCFQMSSASSARVGSVFALGCLLSVSVLAEKSYPSSSHIATSSAPYAKPPAPSVPIYKTKAYCMLTFLAFSTVSLALQTAFLRNLLPISSTVGTLLMFLWGFSLAIPFYLPSSMFALKRGGTEGSATIADAFDVCGFGLLAVFNGFVARILDVSGEVGIKGVLSSRKQAWLPVFQWMLSGSLVAMLSLFGAVWLEGKKDDKFPS